jgi:hypothetical protein
MVKKIALLAIALLLTLGTWFFVMADGDPWALLESFTPTIPSWTPVISGQVTDAATKKPLKDIPVELSFYCTDIEGMSARCANKPKTLLTDTHGAYRFESVLNVSKSFRGYDVVINASEEGFTYLMNAGGGSILNYDADGQGSVGTSLLPNGYYSYSGSFSAQTSGKVNFSTELIPNIANIQDCARMSTKALMMRCANILAYQAAERIWTHADDAQHAAMSYYFQNYFLQGYERQLLGTCQDITQGFCRSLEAIDRKDAAICDKETGRKREECYFAAAVQLNQPDLCRFAPDRIPEMDEQGNYGQHLSKLKCLQYTALKNHNRQACDRLEINPPRDWQGYMIGRGQCVHELAISSQDASVCLTHPGANKDYNDGKTVLQYCVHEVGYRAKNIDACERLHDQDLKEECLTGVQQARNPGKSPYEL